MGEEFLEQSMPKGSESSSVSSLAPNKDDEFRDAEMQHALAQLKEYTEALKGEVAELKQNMATFQDTASPAHKRSLPGEGPAPKKCKMQTPKAKMQTSKANMG